MAKSLPVAHTMAEEDYRPVWQTWTFLGQSPAHIPQERATASVAPSSDENIRRNIQLARVDRRIPIPHLAAQVNLDPSTLASFECGEEILPTATIRSIQSYLGILRGGEARKKIP